MDSEPTEAEVLIPGDDAVPDPESGVALTPFSAIAATLPRNPLDSLSIEMARVTRAVMAAESAKASGTIALTIRVEKHHKVPRAILIDSTVVAKLPKEPAASALLFADGDGVITDRDPDQHEMFARPRGITRQPRK